MKSNIKKNRELPANIYEDVKQQCFIVQMFRFGKFFKTKVRYVQCGREKAMEKAIQKRDALFEEFGE